MSSSTTLAAGKRQKRLSLPNIAITTATAQNRLATGRRANSALDNPTGHVAAAAPNDRTSDLRALLDSICQAQQTLSAADTGIASLAALVQSLRSLATQALQACKGNVTSANITATK